MEKAQQDRMALTASNILDTIVLMLLMAMITNRKRKKEKEKICKQLKTMLLLDYKKT